MEHTGETPERTEESRKQESNRPPESMEAQMRFRDLRPISIPSTPDIQPEREITPNIQHDLTDLPDPSTGETAPNDEDTRVLGEAIDLEPSPDQPMESINEDNPDLDNPTNEEPALVLHCQPCNNVHKSPEKTQDLLTCVSATIGEDQGTCLLAEDGFSYIHDPTMPTEEQAFHLEIALTERDIDLWLKEANLEQMAHVATAGKRARAEVKLHTLTNAERLLFDAAKDKELSCWIQTNAIRPILRQRLNPEQILQSRWVLVWKEGDSPSQKRAKARLVVLGFMDPRLCEVERDAPTLTREGRTTVLQCIASHQWKLSSFDITTAFLRGKQTPVIHWPWNPHQNCVRNSNFSPVKSVN